MAKVEGEGKEWWKGRGEMLRGVRGEFGKVEGCVLQGRGGRRHLIREGGINDIRSRWTGRKSDSSKNST